MVSPQGDLSCASAACMCHQHAMDRALAPPGPYFGPRLLGKTLAPNGLFSHHSWGKLSMCLAFMLILKIEPRTVSRNVIQKYKSLHLLIQVAVILHVGQLRVVPFPVLRVLLLHQAGHHQGAPRAHGPVCILLMPGALPRASAGLHLDCTV